ncbi:TPR end-of-group domain-containing protein [Tautonia sociabilis]|uniref:Tetratricopeptide repeat protein n=1 Tax=Tautonia sociabilis TaxID=2080755 RepID=A0A432MEX5_9BACT|nr:hypothetical protein [Tautonia sociabilis]RUL84322.1 hypothetical protein TsocGM_20550 [Tautonia sociabilis]
MRMPRVPQLLATVLQAGALQLVVGCGWLIEEAPPPEVEEAKPEGTLDPDSAKLRVPGKPPFVTAPRERGRPISDEELKEMTAAELVDRSRLTFEADERIRILRAALEKEPENRDARLELMVALEDKGTDLALNHRLRDESKRPLNEAAQLARELLAEQPIEDRYLVVAATAFYNEACNRSLDGQLDEAVASLREAFELGFDNPIILDDPELDPLRDREDFQELLDRLSPPPEHPGSGAGIE